MNPTTFEPGDLKHLAVFKRDTISRDTDGSQIKTQWVVATRRAYVEAQGGIEAFRGQQFIAEGSWQVITRFWEGAQEQDYVEVAGHVLQIVDVGPDMARKRFVEFRCKEINH